MDGHLLCCVQFLFFFSCFCFPNPFFFSLPALICVHVQAELCTQVEVEKRVDAEDEEQDRHDDQERVLQRQSTSHFIISVCSAVLTRRSDSALFGIITGFLFRICGVSQHLQGPRGVSV